MAKLETEQLRDEKYRAQIRETAPELRELEAKLRAGYTSKELQNQITQRVSHKEEETRQLRETARELACVNTPTPPARQAVLCLLPRERAYAGAGVWLMVVRWWWWFFVRLLRLVVLLLLFGGGRHTPRCTDVAC
jgi:hypothetical protein